MAESGETWAWPQRLHHEVPGWVKAGAVFHVRLRVDAAQEQSLIESKVAERLLAAVRNYDERNEWRCLPVLLMPDHIHALLVFPPWKSMATVVGNWKRYAARSLGVKWQKNFFDHRVRSERELAETWSYVLRNPVAKGLCEKEEDWRWVWRTER